MWMGGWTCLVHHSHYQRWLEGVATMFLGMDGEMEQWLCFHLRFFSEIVCPISKPIMIFPILFCLWSARHILFIALLFMQMKFYQPSVAASQSTQGVQKCKTPHPKLSKEACSALQEHRRQSAKEYKTALNNAWDKWMRSPLRLQAHTRKVFNVYRLSFTWDPCSRAKIV